jgi:hypothetical protein
MRAVTRLAGQRRESAASWSLAGATTLALAAALVLLVPNAPRIDAGRIGIYAVLAVAVGLYAGTGHLITRRLLGNAIGWLLSLMGLSLAVTMVTEQYALYGLTRGVGAGVPGPADRMVLRAAGFAHRVPAGVPGHAVPGRAAALAPVAAAALGNAAGRSGWHGGAVAARRNHRRRVHQCAECGRGQLPEPGGDITGALLISGDWFAQTLEGDEDTIRALFATIARDGRHERVSILAEETVPARLFSKWAMARVSADGGPDIPLIAHTDGISPAAGRGTTPEQDAVLGVMREATRSDAHVT